MESFCLQGMSEFQVSLVFIDWSQSLHVTIANLLIGVEIGIAYKYL